MDKFFNCDVCGRAVNGITQVNGMNFCAKCYQETFGMSDLIKNNAQHTEQLLKENAQLKKNIEVLERALGLACKNVNYIATEEGIISAGLFGENVDKIKNHVIEKAKKELEDK